MVIRPGIFQRLPAFLTPISSVSMKEQELIFEREQKTLKRREDLAKKEAEVIGGLEKQKAYQKSAERDAFFDKKITEQKAWFAAERKKITDREINE